MERERSMLTDTVSTPKKSLPVATMTEDPEFNRMPVDDWCCAVADTGDETLDLESRGDFKASFKSPSVLVASVGCVIIPYKTSAISNSISSWFDEVVFEIEDLGALLCLFDPITLYKKKPQKI